MNIFDEEDYIVRRRRRNEPDFWQRLNKVLTALVVLGVLLGIGVMFYPVWHKQRDMRERIAALSADKAEKTAQLAAARRELHLLKNDPEYVETIARDRINVMKPGETIYRVEIPRS
ncbi:MAG: FtsB family cell division protein [Chthoniobacterales bacterium]|jgi:cell division protein DivIC